MNSSLSPETFAKIEMHVGKIIKAESFPKANKPAYLVWVDLGPAIGIRKTSAQITQRYSIECLVGQMVVCVTNFPVKQIANIQSECLLLGALDEQNGTALLQVPMDVPLGSRIA